MFAEVVVDSGGRYQDHAIVQPGYVCLNCGAPAVDLAAVTASMAADDAADSAPVALNVLCPACETAVSVAPGEDCPNCGAELAVGGGAGSGD